MIGKTNYFLKLPHVHAGTPSQVAANMRELERWGNNLPSPSGATQNDVASAYGVYAWNGGAPTLTWSDLENLTVTEVSDLVPVNPGRWMVTMEFNVNGTAGDNIDVGIGSGAGIVARFRGVIAPGDDSINLGLTAFMRLSGVAGFGPQFLGDTDVEAADGSTFQVDAVRISD